ncbi:MAG TPA: polyprenyl synthetase family protein [Thermoflexia bacterium]|jgi:geranylgeranyl diphosphate synthase type I|nr:polyprenyl synthetase family protein [Thermoflexia bacterium]
MSLSAFTSRYLPALEAEMQAVVTAPAPEVHDLYGYLRYHLGWIDEHFQPRRGRTGKRIRPVLCLLSCEACGGDWEQALPAAAAVELLHNFSLIHDDIEDHDATRRGRPTVWALWGVPQAINAGDALFILAHIALLRLSARGIPAETVTAALRIFDHACLRLTEGQFMDIRFEQEEEVSLEDYLSMIEGKTAALLSAACELGALVAGVPPDQQERLRAFGRHLGLAFQIQDDILGIWGDPEKTGKPVGSDLRSRKKTLPILHGLRHDPALRALLAQPTLGEEEIGQAIQRLEAAGSRAFAEEQARRHIDQALAVLKAADLRPPAAPALHDLTLSLMGRTR